MPTIETASVKHILANKTPLLKVKYPTVLVSEPGVYQKREVNVKQPELYLSSTLATPGSKFVAVFIDLDAPFSSAPFLAPILHGLFTDLVPSGDADADGFVLLKAEKEATVEYGGAGPPPLSGPHRYVYMIWNQDAELTDEKIKETMGWKQPMAMSGRMRFDEEAFEKKIGLQGLPIAGNYFTSN